jgi:hypothetical protein
MATQKQGTGGQSGQQGGGGTPKPVNAAGCTPDECQKFLDCCDDPALKQCVEAELAKCGPAAGAQAGVGAFDWSKLADAATAGIRTFIQALLGVAQSGQTKKTP